MRSSALDARRHAWCKSQALWLVGVSARSAAEDLHGALEIGQEGLVRYAARTIGELSAVALCLLTYYERPLPGPGGRASWALDRLEDADDQEACWTLISGGGNLSLAELGQRCDKLLARVWDIAGELPDPLDPEGYERGRALMGEWLVLLSALGEEHFLPGGWTR